MKKTAAKRRLTLETARVWSQQKTILNDDGDVSDEEYINLGPYTELEAGVADVLANSHASALVLDNLRTLTVADARSLASFSGDLCLNGLETLSVEAEKLLAKSEAQTLEMYRIRKLQTKALTRRLASWGFLNLDDCEISKKAAAEIVSMRCSLSLNSTKRLPPDVRRILVEGECELSLGTAGVLQWEDVKGFGQFTDRVAGRLVFSEATGISREAAAELGGYPGEKIKFSEPVSISPKAAEGLSRFRGTLKFRELKQLLDKAAASLAHATVEINYYATRCAALPRVALSRHGIVVVKDRRVTVENMRDLIAAPHLHFSHLTTISRPVAKLLAERHSGTLTFSAVRTISPEVAAVLSRHRGGIAFDGLERLPPRVASKLSALDGFLAFRGLKALPAAVALELAKHKGRLILDGLECLPSKTVARLQSHVGDLSLTALKTLSVKAARTLAQKPGRKVLTSLRSLDAMYVLLERDKDRVVVPFQLNGAGDLV